MPMRLGMMGMWHTHADGIVRQVVAHPDEFRLVGFYDSDPAVVAGRRQNWGPTVPEFRVFDRPEDLLREPLDGVVVEGQVFENLRLARLALESGRSVMLEKPAGEDLDEFRRLIDLAQRKHLHLQMIYLFRYMSAVLDLIGRVRRGELGRIYEFRARLPKDLPSYGSYERGMVPAGVDQRRKVKKTTYAQGETKKAKRAYEHARAVYRRIAEESGGPGD